jgi:hypothetical protein
MWGGEKPKKKEGSAVAGEPSFERIPPFLVENQKAFVLNVPCRQVRQGAFTDQSTWPISFSFWFSS